MGRTPDVSEGWAEGRYMDLWMVVHFLAGVVGAFTNVFFSLRHVFVYAIGAAMMIAWEFIEHALGVREKMPNRVIDVVVGLAGVWVALQVAERVERRWEYWLLGLTFGTALALMAFGVRAAKARKK